jgi:hypothetical protein
MKKTELRQIYHKFAFQFPSPRYLCSEVYFWSSHVLRILFAHPYYIRYVKEAKASLSHLAHVCMAADKYRPETCCVVGNYYSLKVQVNVMFRETHLYLKCRSQADSTFFVDLFPLCS